MTDDEYNEVVALVSRLERCTIPKMGKTVHGAISVDSPCTHLGAALWRTKKSDENGEPKAFSCDKHIGANTSQNNWTAVPYAKQLRKILYRIARHKLGENG